MKSAKKWLAFLLAFVMVMAMTTAFADEEKPTWIHYNRNEGTRMAEDDEKVFQWMQEQLGFNCDIRMYPAGDLTSRMQMVFNSGEAFDSFGLLAYAANIELLKANGLIQPLNPYLEEYGQHVMEVYPDNAWDLVIDKDGLIWSLTRCEVNYRGNQPAIREDWVEKLGMEMPTSIVELEEWMQAVLDNDVNGNGIVDDEIPMALQSGLWSIRLDFFPPFLGWSGETYMDDEGNIASIYTHPDFKNLLAKLNEWYEKGYIYKEWNTMDNYDDLKNADRIGMYTNYFIGGDTTWKNVPGCVYSPLPPFTDAPGASAWTASPQYSTVMALYSGAEHPELAIKYIDWVCSDPANALTMQYGLEGENWQWIDQAANEFETIDGWNDRYSSPWKLVDTYFDGFWPTAPTTTDYILQDRARVKELTKDWTYLPNMNNHFFFNYEGTDAEYFTGDGYTLLEEAMIKIVYGQMDVSEWDDVVAEYNELEGDTYKEIWTEQYNDKYAFKFTREFMTGKD